MILILENIFDKEKCNFLSNVMIYLYNKKKLNFEGTNEHYGNSFGTGGLKEFEKILEELTPIVMQKTGLHDITIQNSYSRIYFNDSVLKKHVDRKDLDVTLSVCIYDDTGVEWPLHVETEEGIKSIVTKPGNGAVILGTKMHHWRDRLVCDNNKMVIQCFFHWKLWKNLC